MKNEYEAQRKEIALDCSAGDCRDDCFRLNWRHVRDALVELAGADVVPIAADYFLASAGNPDVVPNPVRRIWNERWAALPFRSGQVRRALRRSRRRPLH